MSQNKIYLPRGRSYLPGEKHIKSKLTQTKVDMARSLHERFDWGYKRLAKRFEVSVRTMRDIVNYKTWCS